MRTEEAKEILRFVQKDCTHDSAKGWEKRRVEAIDHIIAEITRLEAVNAELVTELQRLLEWATSSEYDKLTGRAEHDDVVKNRAQAALAKAAPSIPPPQASGE